MPSSVLGGYRNLSDVVVDETEDDIWDQNKVMNAIYAEEIRLLKKSRELQTKCRAVHIEGPAA